MQTGFVLILTLCVNNYFSSLMFSSQKLQNRVAKSTDIPFWPKNVLLDSNQGTEGVCLSHGRWGYFCTGSEPQWQFERCGHPYIFLKKAKSRRNKTKLVLLLKRLFKCTGMFQLWHISNLNRIYLLVSRWAPPRPLSSWNTHFRRNAPLLRGRRVEDAEGRNV